MQEGIKAANTQNNRWATIYWIVRIFLIATPAYILYIVGQMDIATPEGQKGFHDLLQTVNKCGLFSAILAGFDAWINPQRKFTEAHRVRNVLIRLHERLDIAVEGIGTPDITHNTVKWFLDRYQDAWDEFNHLNSDSQDMTP